MRKTFATWAGVAMALGVLTQADDASALLTEKAPFDATDVEFTYHYPYPTTLSYVDPGYAFDDDPLLAFPHRPYRMPVIIKRLAIRRAMVAPRTSFVQEMYDSADVL